VTVAVMKAADAASLSLSWTHWVSFISIKFVCFYAALYSSSIWAYNARSLGGKIRVVTRQSTRDISLFLWRSLNKH